MWCVCEESKVLDWQLLYFHALDAGADLENKAGVPGVFVVCVVCVRNVCVCVCTPYPHVVIGVQHSGDVLCQVAVQHSLDVVAMVDWVHGKNMSSINFLVFTTTSH